MSHPDRTKPYVIFDFDGTIADSLPLMVQTYRDLAQKYKLNSVTDQDILAWRSKSVREIIKLSGISVFKIIPLLREGKELFGQHIKQVQPITGMKPVIALLAKHYHLGIITSNSDANVLEFLRLHQLDAFQFIHSDQTIFGKADVMKKAIKQYAIVPGQAVYVGDEIRDIHASRRCGLPCISVSWGLNSKESLLRHKPLVILDDPQQLPGEIAQRFNPNPPPR